MRGKTLLVLGCGYLGRFLTEKALAEGVTVLAVSRNLDTLEGVKKMGAEVFQGTVEGEDWHAFAGDRVDMVVNCVSSAGGGLAGYRTSYIEGNASLARWAKAVGFKGPAIYTSSVSVYGDAEGKWVDESSASSPANERGSLVLESEQQFLQGLDDARALVLRLAGLYGPGRHLMLDRLREAPSTLPGWGDYYLNLIRIEDVAIAIWQSIVQEVESGIYTIVDNEPSLKLEIVEWLAEELGMNAPAFSGAADPSGRSSRRLGETGRPANRRISNQRFREACSWQPRFASFREGFADLLKRG